MKIYLTLLLSLVIISSPKLYQVLSLCRHGARYHEKDMWDGNQTKPLWAQLTAVGMRQHKTIGELIRKEYIESLNFLSPSFDRNEIEAYSTYTNRTSMSLLSQFYGLYPPNTGPRLPMGQRKWHIPPYTNKTNIDEQNFALPNGHQPIIFHQNQHIIMRTCPNYQKYYQQNNERMADIIDQMRTTYMPFMKKMSNYFNFTLNATTLQQMFIAYDTAIVDSHLGRPWPKDFTKEDFANIRHLAVWHYTTMWTGKNTIMSCSGKINRMLDLFDLRTRVPNTKGIKWTFLFGHEGDMLATQLALNITSSQCIEDLYRKGSTSAYACEIGGLDFASNIIIELHSDDQKIFYVKVRANGNYVKALGQNSFQIPYIAFKPYMKKFTTSNLEQFCGRPLNDPFPALKPDDQLLTM